MILKLNTLLYSYFVPGYWGTLLFVTIILNWYIKIEKKHKVDICYTLVIDALTITNTKETLLRDSQNILHGDGLILHQLLYYGKLITVSKEEWNTHFVNQKFCFQLKGETIPVCSYGKRLVMWWATHTRYWHHHACSTEKTSRYSRNSWKNVFLITGTAS